ncbi:MAG: ATP-dependent Clp protease proteolytic subunit [Candidatus Paceibacterota bacterium]
MDRTELESDLRSNGIFLVTDITHKTIEEIGKWILKCRPERSRFTLLIMSPGGTPSAVLRFASHLRLLKKDVVITGVAADECGSAALALLQCCHTRVAVEYTTFFIHHVQANNKINSYNPDRQLMEEQISSAQRREEELIKLQCTRTGLTREKWVALADRGEIDCDTPIHTPEALELGLIDEIIDFFPCV